MPREAKRLSDRQVAALKTPGFYPVGGDKSKGLALSVAPKRSKGAHGMARSWILRVATGETRLSKSGKPFAVRRDFGLGSYPEVGLAEARERAAELRVQLRSGVDPVEKRKSERAAKRAESAKLRTFEAVARECHKVRQSEFRNAKYAAQWLATLETYAFPKLGKLSVGDIETGHLVDVLRDIWTTKHETANNVRQRIGKVLDYASACGLRTTPNPADMRGGLRELLPKSGAVRKKAGGRRHHARIAVEAMPRFWADLTAKRTTSAKALQFTILTAARSGEVRGATWEEIDFNARVWRLSADRMKADRVHRVPLSKAAITLLEAIKAKTGKENPGGLIFTNHRGAALSDMALSKLMKDMHALAIKAGTPGYLDPDQGRVATPHGTARSSFKDWARRSTSRVLTDGNLSSFPDEVSELALAHVNSDETRSAYARDELLEDRRELMQTWAHYLQAIDTAVSTAKVRKIGSRA
jgi:integrase